METFWKTIASYNSSTWICQIVIVLVAVILTVWLLRKRSRAIVVGMKLFLIALYVWIALVYYYVYCSERSYNSIMVIFWLVLAVSWLWDLVSGYTTFERDGRYTKLALVLLCMPFLYPVASILRGMSFPAITSPVMPCSVVVFTIGLQLMFSRKVNLFIVLLLCHWSMIGLSKTLFYNIPEDYIMTMASVPAVYLFVRDYFLSGIHTMTKPQVKYMRWLLAALCAGVCLILVWTLYLEFARGIL